MKLVNFFLDKMPIYAFFAFLLSYFLIRPVALLTVFLIWTIIKRNKVSYKDMLIFSISYAIYHFLHILILPLFNPFELFDFGYYIEKIIALPIMSFVFCALAFCFVNRLLCFLYFKFIKKGEQ